MAVVAGGFLCCYRSFYESHRQNINLLLMTMFFMSYLSLGGLIFKRLEGFQDDTEVKNLADAKAALLKKHPNISSEAVDDLFRELTDRGIKGLNADNSTTKWTFGNAILFSATLLTTVGYGHLSPVSRLGKVVCMLYTAVGIPITLYLMAMYVTQFSRWSDNHRESLFRRFKNHLAPHFIHTLHATTCSMLVIIGSFFLPASLFDYLEVQWDYFDALYFCFISLTTVGLGDFVPGLNTNSPYIDLYRFAATVYLLLGVTAIMFLLAIFNEYILNLKSCWYYTPKAEPIEKEALIHDDIPSYGSIIVRTIQIPEDVKIQLPS